jgi:hypothetical protein
MTSNARRVDVPEIDVRGDTVTVQPSGPEPAGMSPMRDDYSRYGEESMDEPQQWRIPKKKWWGPAA